MAMESRKEHKNNIACVWCTHTVNTTPSHGLTHKQLSEYSYVYAGEEIKTKKKQDHQLQRIYKRLETITYELQKEKDLDDF